MRALVLACLLMTGCAEKVPVSREPSIVTSTDPGTLRGWSERLTTLRGARVSTASIADDVALVGELPKDRTVLVSFWATYCPPCIEEMTGAQLLFSQGRAIVGVSLDSGEVQKAVRVLEQKKVRYPNVVLDERSMKVVGAALERGLPFSLLVDANGRALELVHGAMDGAEIESLFTRHSPEPKKLDP